MEKLTNNVKNLIIRKNDTCSVNNNPNCVYDLV